MPEQYPYPTSGDDIPRRQREWQAQYGAPPAVTSPPMPPTPAPSPVLPPFPPPGGDWNTIQPVPGENTQVPNPMTQAMYPGQQASTAAKQGGPAVMSMYPDYSQFVNRFMQIYPRGL